MTLATGSDLKMEVNDEQSELQSVSADLSDVVLREIVRRLVLAFQPERIYLFGSKARGTGGADSDYDLMVVVADDLPAEKRRSRLAYEALRGTGVAADVMVWTRSRFDSRLHLRASFPSAVVREGRLLYMWMTSFVWPTPGRGLTAAADIRAA